jgi:hypothetical protein
LDEREKRRNWRGEGRGGMKGRRRGGKEGRIGEGRDTNPRSIRRDGAGPESVNALAVDTKIHGAIISVVARVELKN